MALTERREDDNINSYIQEGAFGVKGKSMRTLEEVKRLAEGFRKLYDDARVFGVKDGRKVRADDTAGECYACLRNGYPCRKCVAASALDEKREKCKIESFGRDIALITAQYMEIEGQPYVLETVQLLPDGSIMEPDEGEYLLAKMTGYNTKLYHDALTGIYNRRYYEDIARNMSGPSGVAIMDLDDFKVHNDTYGHHGGDIALEVVADVVKGNIRKCDSLIRFGGDEFLLILANMPEKTLKKKLEKIRDQVHAAVIHECPHLRVSVSIGGVAQGEHETMDSAVRRADRLLYHAKTTKNEVVVESDNTLSESVQTKNCVKPLILIVDDCDMNREILREILSSDYSIMEACGGEEALSMIHQFGTGISLVLLDIVMPGLDGFEVLSYMNQDHTIEDIPVIMISSEDSEAFIRRAYEMGASDYVSRPFDAKVVYRRVTNNIKLYAKQRRLIRMVTEQIREREENVSMLVGVLSQIVEFRNGESGLHVKHIRRFTECILDCLIEKDPDLHLGTKERENIPLASALHDIGKIAVDDKILNKPGRLTPEEFEAMKLHTVYGAKMLEELQPYYDEPLLKTATDIAHWHHERWDGRGYPDGLVGDAIPLSAQIVSLADVYDALTSERCYKKAYSHDKAVEMILNGECGVFNPKLVECFVEIQNVLREELCNVKYRDEQK
jgi:diguanylate cyclase (GGDEF) domain